MDHIVLDSKLVISYTKSRTRMVQLQEEHGIGNVIYGKPNFYNTIETYSRKSIIQLVTIFNLSGSRDLELEVQTALVESKYDCEIDVCDELDYYAIQESDIVILLGGTLKSLYHVLHKNFLLYRWESNYYLRENNLDHRIVQSPQHLAELININMQDIEIHTNYSSMLSSYLPLYKYLELGTQKRDLFYVDRSMYKNSSILHPLAETFWVDGASARNGIYLDLAVVRTFHLYRRPHLYPWIGILEISDLEDIRQFLTSDIFRISESMCLGLITFNQSISNIIDKRVPTLVLSKYLCTEGKRWNYEKWLENPTIVSIDSLGVCTILELITRNKTTSTSILECLQTSVLVLTNKTEPYLGILTYALGICTPIVLSKNHILATHLGVDNPLLLSRLNYSALKNSLSPSLVKQGFEYMCNKRNMYTIESFLNRLQSSYLGTSARSLLEHSRA